MSLSLSYDHREKGTARKQGTDLHEILSHPWFWTSASRTEDVFLLNVSYLLLSISF